MFLLSGLEPLIKAAAVLEYLGHLKGQNLKIPEKVRLIFQHVTTTTTTTTTTNGLVKGFVWMINPD